MLRRVCVAVAAIALCVPELVWAEEPTAGEVSGSCSLLQRHVTSGSLDSPGWSVSGSWSPGWPVAMVAEAGGNYRRKEICAPRRCGGAIHYSLYALLGGVRLSGHGKRGGPFVQVLAGASGQLETEDEAIGGDHYRALGLAVQPGVGLSVLVSQRVAVRVAMDYRWVQREGDQRDRINALRFQIGAAVVFAGAH